MKTDTQIRINRSGAWRDEGKELCLAFQDYQVQISRKHVVSTHTTYSWNLGASFFFKMGNQTFWKVERWKADPAQPFLDMTFMNPMLGSRCLKDRCGKFP